MLKMKYTEPVKKIIDASFRVAAVGCILSLLFFRPLPAPLLMGDCLFLSMWIHFEWDSWGRGLFRKIQEKK